MRPIIKAIPTLIEYFKWRRIIKDNKDFFKKSGISIDWIYRLGFIVELSEDDIRDLESINRTLDSMDEDSVEYNSLLMNKEIIKEKYKNVAMATELAKYNEIFLTNGIRELVDDGINPEEYEDYEYVFTFLLSFKIYEGFSFLTFLIDLPFYIFIHIYFVLLYLKNKLL